MYVNHNHAYDEIHQVHHDQNKERETKKKNNEIIFEKKKIFFFLLDVLLGDYWQKNPKPYLDLLNVFQDYVFENE
jgi:hypothetical protein